MTTAALKAVATGEAQQQRLASMKPKDQVAHLLQQKAGEISKMLPKHLNPERLLKVAQVAATTTPALLECYLPTLIGAIAQCAQMGLEPNTILGHAYLVPFWNAKKKRRDVQVIIGYKGLIDLARRSGQIVSIAAHEVCQADKFELVYGLEEKLVHVPDLGERGAVIGYYAVAKLKDGGHCFEFMSQNQVLQIMKETQSKGEHGPWKDHAVEMGRKTVIRRLAKYLPLSIEFQTAVALDGMAESGQDQRNDEAMAGDYSILPDDAPGEDAPGVDYDTGEITPQLDHKQPITIPQQSAQTAAADQWRPDPEEEAAIRAAELAESQRAAQPAAPRQRRERGGLGLE
ncbi:MAG: recombinase RecT [Candidatus Accumulibacter sp.]|uniref:recombinase RecT n=1 Tax=Accumulibacter sp. TaxID=2053492 RepID=UPI002586E376|nr:recombinase RecT [Accumulibacter sp.]MBK8117482.1 recombinase RecT [Accumulibacter sp.]